MKTFGLLRPGCGSRAPARTIGFLDDAANPTRRHSANPPRIWYCEKQGQCYNPICQSWYEKQNNNPKEKYEK